jgi:DNA-binding transcriptional regulator YdaS (Cro superfamily)
MTAPNQAPVLPATVDPATATLENTMPAPNQVQVTAEQQKAIEALLGEKKLETVAKEAGVSPDQLQQWLDCDANFQAAYQSAVRNATQIAISRIKAGTSLAVETLLKAMKDGENSAQKIRAAKALLACADSLAQRESLEGALAEIAPPDAECA